MRIIAGEHRGRRLLGPADAKTTRPITDRVKVSLFDRLSAAGRLEGAKAVDIFSGTGSMGLECLSRGAERAWFVERDREALRRLRANLDTLGLAERATVLAVDALGNALTSALTAKGVDLLFFDPPYAMMQAAGPLERATRQIERLASVAAPDAWLIWRTPDRVTLGPVDGWGEPDSHDYGSMTLHIYRRGDASTHTQ